MSVIGLLLNGVDFTNLFVVLSNPNNVVVPSLAAVKEAGVATLNIGLFINGVVKFVIIAFVLFLVVKGINSMKRKQQAASPAPAAPSQEVVLLAEIRDSLRTGADARAPSRCRSAGPRLPPIDVYAHDVGMFDAL